MTAPRYNPIKLRGSGPTASETVIRDRDRFCVSEQPGKGAREAKKKQSADEEQGPAPNGEEY
jgi:hypothetical protein